MDRDRQIRDLHALLEVSQAMSSERSLDNLLQIIVHRAEEVLRADHCTLFLYDESRNELWSKFATQLGDLREIRFPVGRGIAGEVASTRKATNIPDAYADPRFNPEFDQKTDYKTRSILCMPMIGSDQELIGVIEILNKKSGEAFDHQDEALLEALGSHAAVALDRARLVEAYLEKQRMEVTLRLAHQIQMSLLPKSLPPFPFSHHIDLYTAITPAKEVGGDFYDYFFIDEDHLCLCIGDVSGKGVPAALFMAISKVMIKSRAADDFSPASILTHVNDELAADNEALMFVTVFLMIVNVHTGDFVYTNGGHNPPYLKRADGRIERLAELHGPVLGPMSGMAFKEGRNRLQRGDTVLLYTDGVTEAMSPVRKLYGEKRLVEILGTCEYSTPEDLVTAIVKDIEKFVAGAEQSDDITLLTFLFLATSTTSGVTKFKRKIKNHLSEVGNALKAFDDFAQKNKLQSETSKKVKLALDEMLNNIISYGYSDGGEHEIEVLGEVFEDHLTILITDDGVPFNPFQREAPDTTLSVQDRDFGGLGIHLVRNTMDEVSYKRGVDRNIVRLVKFFQ
jgi:sigma-B regulation protein RsbU (phosphoserine phosphatase)